MELNTGRIGSCLSDRIVVESSPEQSGLTLRATNSLCDWLRRIVSWIYSPHIYSDENRKTVSCFKKYLTDQLGNQRFKRICRRYQIDIDSIEKKGNPLLSRDIAKIKTGIEDVQVEDIEEIIKMAKNDAICPQWLKNNSKLRSILRKASTSEGLSRKDFALVYETLQKVLSDEVSLPHIEKIRGGRPTQMLARFFFDRFLADRERLILQRENSRNRSANFVHHFSVRVMRRELDVGMLIPAPKSKGGEPQFYRVGGKLITGEGMVSYWLIPATKKTDLEPVRFYRGTTTHVAEIDASSTIITDLEKNIGERAWNSGQKYAPLIKILLPKTPKIAGHSLGSILAQYDLIDNPDIRKAYLYNGPGISESQVEAFNMRMRKANTNKVELIIRDCHKDSYSAFGRVHLGYKAPRDKVSIKYRKYYPLRTSARTGRIHTTVWELEGEVFGIEGGHNLQKLDALLHHKELNFYLVWMRETFGPCFGRVIRFARDFFRSCFGSRALEQRGLQIGRFKRDSWWEREKWTVQHIRLA